MVLPGRRKPSIPHPLLPSQHTPSEEKVQLHGPFQSQVALEQVSKPTLEKIQEKQIVEYFEYVNPVHRFSCFTLMLFFAF